MNIKEFDTRLPQGDMSGILLRDCNWAVKTAGPSPDDNNRTEIFLLGCQKAMSGNPCKGCFNSTTWDKSKAQWSHDPIKMAEHISNCAPNRYITIGGGEPTDQIDNLIILCRELKKYGFHIMMYTWRDLKLAVDSGKIVVKHHEEWKFREKMLKLLKYIDIVVDGQYKEELRMWDGTKEDGLISSIGSGNQIVWDIRDKIGYAMKDIVALYLREIERPDDLQYVIRNNAEEFKLNY